jgi:hypothetical protein
MSDKDRNGQFCIKEFSFGGHEYSIYILNPGNCFQGFGGTSGGLVVRKTASLIVRDNHAGGCDDTEYDVNDKKVWARLLTLMATVVEDTLWQCLNAGN